MPTKNANNTTKHMTQNRPSQSRVLYLLDIEDLSLSKEVQF